MKRGEYYRGRNGRKYGIWNTAKKCFQFGIAEDTPMLAEARLFYMIGDDARKWRSVSYTHLDVYKRQSL